jgi:hypothetical protein
MRYRSLLSVAALAALVSLAGASCLSPTLPLPPPDVPSSIIAGATPGTWEVIGDCEPGAEVMVVNNVTGQGVVTTDLHQTGTYHVELQGALCTWATVTEDVGGELSSGTQFQLAAWAPGDPGDPTNNDACQ